MKILVIGDKGKLAGYTKDPSLLEKFEIDYVPVRATDEEILAAGGDADIILADAISKVSANVIMQMDKLKMIHSEGVAYNAIDIEAARKKQVYVCNCKGMNATAVAEHTIMLMLGVLKDICVGDACVRTGKQIEKKTGYMVNASLKELRDCTVGLVGFGDIAKATARLLQAFGAKVLYYRPSGPDAEEIYGTYCELDALLAQSDIVSLHLPVLEGTKDIADKEFFQKMKPGAYLINTSRGELVKEEDLLEALEQGILAGAGLDTVKGEPVGKDHILLPEKRIIFSCHIGGITASSFARGYEMIWEDIQLVAAGKEPKRIVNPW